jgi:hypothetical protein
MNLNNDHGRRVFVLEIAGLSTRYYSGPNPAGSNLPSTIATGINYTNVESLVSVGAYTASLDPSGGVATYGAINVELTIDQSKGSNDAGLIFGRCGVRSSDVTRAQVSTLMPHEQASITIDVDRDLSSLSYPRLFHIGAETVRATSATSSTVTIAERGAGGTPVQIHSTTNNGTNVPELTTDIITFRGRRASIWIAQQSVDGTLSDYTEIVNGFIESTPTIEDSTIINLSIVPLTALFDNALSQVSVETELLHNYHYFESDRGNIFEFGLWQDPMRNDNTIYVNGSFLSGIGTASASYDVSGSSDRLLLALKVGQGTDATLNDGTENGQQHPRYPALTLEGSAKIIRPKNTTSDSRGRFLSFDFDDTNDNIFASITDSTIVYRPFSLIELKRYTLGSDEVKRWPEVINDQVNDATNGITDYTGINGGVASFIIENDRIKMVNRGRDPHLFFFSSRESSITTGQTWASVPIHYASANDYYGPIDNLSRAYFGIDFLQLDDDEYAADPVINPDSGELRQPQVTRAFYGGEAIGSVTFHDLRGVAAGYYQLLESKMLVKDSLNLPSSAGSDVFDVQVKYFDRELGEESIQWFKASHQTVATFGGSDVGYLIHLVDDPADLRRYNKSFGDFPGNDRARITIGARLSQQRPGQLLLKLLESGGGGSVNGSYDVLGFGLNINNSDINEASFLMYDALSNLSLDLFISSADVQIREVVDPLLKMMGAALVMTRSSSGKSRISLQPLGDERAAASRATISAGEWIADPSPVWDIYEDIVTQVNFKYDYDSNNQKFLTVNTVNNQEAMNRYGEERAAIDLDLYGYSSAQIGFGSGDYYTAFLPVFSRIFRILSDPLRVWRGSIGTGKSIFLDVGSYLTVSSPHLKGYGATYGVTNGVGQLRSIRQELMGEGAEIELIHSGLKSTGWNAAADVTSTLTSTSVLISTNNYTSTDIFGDTVRDGQFFQAGDVVDYLPRGDEDNAITGLVILSVTGTFFNTVTFTTAHGITATGGTIEPTAYGSASTNHKQYAYIDQNEEYS